MKLTAQATLLGVLMLAAALAVAFRPVLAQAPARPAPMHVHHVHLNSVEPKVAAEYYPKAFAATAVTTTSCR